jgi:hypothetical protein
MIDVLFVAIDDWANVGALCAKACRSVGLKSKAVARRIHEFHYPTKPELWRSVEDLQALCDQSRAIVFMHSTFISAVRLNRETQRVAVFHGGSAYRRRPWKIAQALFDKVDLSFVQDGTLFGFGGKNETLLIPPVDDEYFVPRYSPLHTLANRIVVGNYPRATGHGYVMKGARVVVNAVRPHVLNGSCIFKQSTTVVPWIQQLSRVNEVDVYVEKMGLEVREWGLAALEAAALGKVVVTNCEHPEEYEKVYGKTPFIIANSPDELRERVGEIVALPPAKIRKLQEETRTWVIRNHGMEATGYYLEQALRH